MTREVMKLVSNSKMISLQNTSYIPDGVKIIGASEFWERGNKGENITIAIIDTGCDINHPDLKDRIIGVRNFTSDSRRDVNNVIDYVGHGTHVAGTIAASDNGKGIVGVAPKAKLLILKALSRSGGQYSWVINAINYAVSKNVDIISMSLGGPIDNPQLHKAIKGAVDNEILVVCAAGNSGDNNASTIELSYPAAYNEVISVGSFNANRQASGFSSSNNEVDLVAPGQGYGNNGVISTAPGGKYVEMQGTSMATPHVAGALALIKNWANKTFGRKLTEAELYAQLIRKTVTLGYSKNTEGNGMLYLLADDVIEKIIKNEDLLKKILNN